MQQLQSDDIVAVKATTGSGFETTADGVLFSGTGLLCRLRLRQLVLGVALGRPSIG